MFIFMLWINTSIECTTQFISLHIYKYKYNIIYFVFHCILVLMFFYLFLIFFSFVFVSISGNATSYVNWSGQRYGPRFGILWFMDFIRSACLYSIHIEFMRDITRSILGNNKATRIWSETNAPTDDVVRGTGLAGCCMHLFATTANIRQCA